MFLLYLACGLAAALLLAGVVTVLFRLVKKMVVRVAVIVANSVIGWASLLGLNYLGFSIPISLPIIAITGLFGVPGIISLAILDYFKMI